MVLTIDGGGDEWVGATMGGGGDGDDGAGVGAGAADDSFKRAS